MVVPPGQRSLGRLWERPGAGGRWAAACSARPAWLRCPCCSLSDVAHDAAHCGTTPGKSHTPRLFALRLLPSFTTNDLRQPLQGLRTEPAAAPQRSAMCGVRLARPTSGCSTCILRVQVVLKFQGAGIQADVVKFAGGPAGGGSREVGAGGAGGRQIVGSSQGVGRARACLGPARPLKCAQSTGSAGQVQPKEKLAVHIHILLPPCRMPRRTPVLPGVSCITETLSGLPCGRPPLASANAAQKN